MQHEYRAFHKLNEDWQFLNRRSSFGLIRYCNSIAGKAVPRLGSGILRAVAFLDLHSHSDPQLWTRWQEGEVALCGRALRKSKEFLNYLRFFLSFDYLHKYSSSITLTQTNHIKIDHTSPDPASIRSRMSEARTALSTLSPESHKR